MLFHPEFYKVVVTNSGCHDNRMDKMWWNEQWMGWPLGPQYAASSNVDNAYRLQGKALIIVGEMDTNVDPASSLQVVNALVKAHKHFDMLYIPGQNHGVGSPRQRALSRRLLRPLSAGRRAAGLEQGFAAGRAGADDRELVFP